MATSAGEGTSYQGGAGGKFRKKPFRRPQTTPYDRPQITLRNPRANNSWLSKIVDPASKLITASAHLFFSSVFRKRLPPPPPPGANQESRDRFQDTVLHRPAGDQGPVVHDSGKQSLAEDQGLEVHDSGKQMTTTDSSGLSELELMLKQKTFTRSEIDRLTELLRSRTEDLCNGDEDKNTDFCLQEPVPAIRGQDKVARSPLQETRVESHLDIHKIHGCVSTPIVSSKVFEEDVATPAELAKAYMGNRSSKMSPSVLGLRSQVLREEAIQLNNLPFPPRSPGMSLVKKPVIHAGVPENGFMTPRSRGRSAIYNMARTPYSKVHPSATHKGNSSVYDGYGGPSAASSVGFARELVGRSVSKELALKRRSFVLDDEIGSVGPIRRLRQKTNLSTPSNTSFSVDRTPFSSRGTGIVSTAYQAPSSFSQKLPSLHESKRGISNTVRGTEDNNMPGTSYIPVPSASKETAKKILLSLQKFVPKDKSSEGKAVALCEKSPSKLTPNMLRGQALRSLEDVDSSKILHNAGDSFKDTKKNSSSDACETSSRRQDTVEENGPKNSIVSHGTLAPAGTSNATVSFNETIPAIASPDSVKTQFETKFPQKKWAFQMSAHEDLLELDDEIHLNEATSTQLAEGKKILETPVVDSKAISSEILTVDKTSAVSVFKMPTGSVLGKPTDLGTIDGSTIAEKNNGFTFSPAPAASTLFQPVVAISQSPTLAKIVPDGEPSAPPPLLSSGTKNDDSIPPLIFSSPSSFSRSLGLASTALSEVRQESTNSLAVNASGSTESLPKITASEKGDIKNIQKSEDAVGKLETSFSLPQSASASSIFSLGASANFSSLSNGSLNSSPSIFSSAVPVLSSSNSESQTFPSSFTSSAFSTTPVSASTSLSMAPIFKVGSDASPSTTTATPPLPTDSIFKFGSTSIAPSSSGSTVSTTSNATDIKASTEKETSFGNLPSNIFGGTSFSMASSGSSIFGFSAGSTSSTTMSLSQGSLFSSSSGSTISTQSMPVFGSSASSSILGTSGSASFTPSNSLFGSSTSSGSVFGNGTSSSSVFGNTTSGSSIFGNTTSSSSVFGNTTSSSSLFSSSTSSSSLFGSSTASKDFGSSPSFGLSSSASSADTKSITSAGPTSTLWQAPSTGFTFGASPSTVFGSSTSASSSSVFSYGTSTPSFSQTQPVFGSSVPVFTSAPAPGNGDQMSMEDSMAEDTVQGSTTPVPVFGQAPFSNPSPGFVFGSTTPSGSPFQFGGQSNQGTPQNPASFQPSGSLDFGGGGSFSLGSGGGGDRSSRKIIRVKHKGRRK